MKIIKLSPDTYKEHLISLSYYKYLPFSRSYLFLFNVLIPVAGRDMLPYSDK